MTRVAITLTSGALAGLETALASCGVDAVRAPLIACEPVVNLQPLVRGLRAIDGKGTLVVTSPRAAQVVADVAARPALASCRPRAVWAVGAAAAEPLRRRFRGVRCPPPTAATAAGLARAMLDAAVPPPVLFARGDRSRGDLPRALRARGIPVCTAVVYRTVPAPDPAGRLPACDVIVLGSPSAAQTARGIVRPGTAIVAIGETTARTARALGLAVRAVAATPDVPGIVLAIRSVLA